MDNTKIDLPVSSSERQEQVQDVLTFYYDCSRPDMIDDIEKAVNTSKNTPPADKYNADKKIGKYPPLETSYSSDETLDTVCSDSSHTTDSKRIALIGNRRIIGVVLCFVVLAGTVALASLFTGRSHGCPFSLPKVFGATSVMDSLGVSAAEYPLGLSAVEYGSMVFSDAVPQFAGDEVWWNAATAFEWERAQGDGSSPFIIASDEQDLSGWERGMPIRDYFGEESTEKVVLNGDDLSAWVLYAPDSLVRNAPQGVRVQPITPLMKIGDGVTIEMMRLSPSPRSFRLQLCEEPEDVDALIQDLKERAVDVERTREAWFWTSKDGAAEVAKTNDTPPSVQGAIDLYSDALGVVSSADVQYTGSGEYVMLSVPQSTSSEEMGGIVAVLLSAACSPEVRNISFEHSVSVSPMGGRNFQGDFGLDGGGRRRRVSQGILQ